MHESTVMSSVPNSFWSNFGNETAARELNDLQKKLCDKFVEEYMFDGSIVLAAIRCGFSRDFARNYGEQIFHEPYTQMELRRRQEQLEEVDEKEQDKIDKKKARHLLRRMSEHAYPASQVAALGKLVGVLGMNAPIRSDVNMNHRGGVISVPAIASLDSWEQTATSSQRQLVSETHANT